MVYNTELYHHGIKGMRWGVRKNRTTRSKKNPTRFELSNVSDDTLRNKMNRLNLESNYIDAKNRRAKLSTPGRKKTSEYLSKFGALAANAISTTVISLGATYISNKLGIDVKGISMQSKHG